ncbi:MAG: serine hydrolase domain-containing protein [Planctomycetota bacterium]|jgi:CubicO group peptidase (beta-lactamase class C family)
MKREHRFILTLALLLGLSLSCRVDRAYREGLTQIDGVVEEEIQAGHVPGAVVLVGRGDKVVYWKAFGLAVAEPFEAPMRKDTVFDLASLTKPLATAAAIMVLVDRGKLNVDDPVSDYLPAFANGSKEEVRIKHLLTHTSGLPAYTSAAGLEAEHGRPCPEAVMEKICSLEAAAAPGETFTYSCLGYITLAEIVKVVTGQDVGAFTEAHLFGPLGMKDTRFRPPASRAERIAGTEIVEETLLRGTVHDPLAQLMDGLSGNAGLFSTAGDLSIYCRMLLNGGSWKGRRILSRAAVEMLTTAQAHGRGYGFDVASSYSWVKGPHASEATYCHSGYTGTSLVCDPESETYLILLTNRVHPNDEGSVKPLRTKVAEIVFPPTAASAGS